MIQVLQGNNVFSLMVHHRRQNQRYILKCYVVARTSRQTVCVEWLTVQTSSDYATSTQRNVHNRKEPLNPGSATAHECANFYSTALFRRTENPKCLSEMPICMGAFFISKSGCFCFQPFHNGVRGNCTEKRKQHVIGLSHFSTQSSTILLFTRFLSLMAFVPRSQESQHSHSGWSKGPWKS